jgi:serine/threonine protein kinase
MQRIVLDTFSVLPDNFIGSAAFMFRAGAFLARKGWLHCDWKLANILISTIGKFGESGYRYNRLRLGDFGQAWKLPVGQICTNPKRGTERWNAPELLKPVGGYIHPHSDVYSMALVILDLCGLNHREFLSEDDEMDGTRAEMIQMMKHDFPVLVQMLVEEPKERISPLNLLKYDPCAGMDDQAVVDDFCCAFDALAALLSNQSTIWVKEKREAEVAKQLPSLLHTFESDCTDFGHQSARIRGEHAGVDPVSAANFRCKSRLSTLRETARRFLSQY